MKRISLIHIENPDRKALYSEHKKYRVFLGNGAKPCFTDKKHAVKFLADTNQFLNAELQELNNVYADLFCEYRRAWFLLSHSEHLEAYFAEIARNFDLVINRCEQANGNSFTFLNMLKIMVEMESVISRLQAFYKRKLHWSDYNKITTYQIRLRRIRKELESWGQ